MASNIIYVAAADTVFMSLDGGEAWKKVGEGLPGIRITTLAIDPANPVILYAATDGASIYKRQFKLLLISSAVLSSPKTFRISRRNFGRSPRVLINDTDRSALLVRASDTSIQLKGGARELNIKPGENTVQVVSSDGAASNVFILSFRAK